MSTPMESITKRDRLNLLFTALDAADAAASLNEGWLMVDRELRLIEDQHTALPYDRITNYGLGQRMYIPPLTLEDVWIQSGNWLAADLFSHRLRLSDTGSIEIIKKATNEVIFSKS